MSATTTTRTPAAPAATGLDRTGRRRRFVLQTTGQEDVLVRVLTVLRRRGCRIVAVDFREADRHRPGRLDVSVHAPPRVEHAVRSWLMALVDVVAVHEAETDLRVVAQLVVPSEAA